jgi:SecD/SecF fusion protein
MRHVMKSRTKIQTARNYRNWTLWAIPVIVAGWILYLAMQKEGLSWPPSLDFTGGTRLEYRINKEDAIRKGFETSDERREALERCQEVFMFRLRGFDLSEITVKPMGDNRLIIEVPGSEAIERVKENIGDAGVLSFRLVVGDFVSDPEELFKLPEDVRQHYFRYGNENLFLEIGEVLIDASDLSYRGTKVEIAQPTLDDRKGGPYIRLELNPRSRSKFADLTDKYYGERLAICLDNVIISIPKIAARHIREPIITGDYTRTEAEDLVKILRAGPLPVSLNLTSQLLVSPSLGKKAFHQGLTALIIGICFIAILLGLSYVDHLAMLVAFAVCMTLEGALLFIFGRMGWLTLNMISLSGLIVLIGISVDNLILVFEESRSIVSEERAHAYTQENWLMELNNAFRKEKGIIVLANITTVVTLVPLYFLQGPITDLVKMMALGIGLAVLINVWFAGRLLSSRGFVEPLEDASQFPSPLLAMRFPLFSFRRPLLALYLAAVAVSIFLLATRGLERGLDFRGGTEIMLLSDQGIGTDNLRDCASDYFGERCQVKRLKTRYADEVEGFQYVVQVPRVQQLSAEEVGGGQEDADGAATDLTAEKFAEFLGSNVSTPVRIGTVDVLGPTFVALNRQVAVVSVVAGLLALIVIIGLKYGGGYPIPVIVALILDGLIVLGAISLFRIPLSLAAVAAVLTVIGYSINDSIVICGHIHREVKSSATVERERFASILKSLSPRVVLTSLTTAGVAAALWIFGKGLIRDFGLIITVGAVFGTVSSISLVATWLELRHSRGRLDFQARDYSRTVRKFST